VATSVASAALFAGVAAAPAAHGAPGFTNCGGDVGTTMGHLSVRQVKCATGWTVVKRYRPHLKAGDLDVTILGFDCSGSSPANIFHLRCVRGEKRIAWAFFT
jgi:hypothetical protein